MDANPKREGEQTYYLAKFHLKLHETEQNWTNWTKGARQKFYYVDPPLHNVKVIVKSTIPIKVKKQGQTLRWASVTNNVFIDQITQTPRTLHLVEGIQDK